MGGRAKFSLSGSRLMPSPDTSIIFGRPIQCTQFLNYGGQYSSSIHSKFVKSHGDREHSHGSRRQQEEQTMQCESSRNDLCGCLARCARALLFPPLTPLMDHRRNDRLIGLWHGLSRRENGEGARRDPPPPPFCDLAAIGETPRPLPARRPPRSPLPPSIALLPWALM